MSEVRMDEGRRGVDPLIVEMHGMLQRLDQKQDDTLRWVKSTYEDHKEQDDDRHSEIVGRLKPLEDTSTFIRTCMKVIGWLIGLGGIGGVLAAGKAFLTSGAK